MRKSLLIAGVLAAAGFGGPVFADTCSPATGANLVANPSFAQNWNGTSNAQAYSPPDCWTSTSTLSSGADNSGPYDSDVMDGFLLNGTLSQSIATTDTATYSISFEVAEASGLYFASNVAEDSLEVMWGGITIDTINGLDSNFSGPGDYFQETELPVLGDPSSTTLEFSATDATNDGNFLIDDVTVTCSGIGCPVTVPEPNSLALLVTALFGLGAYATRHRTQRMNR